MKITQKLSNHLGLDKDQQNANVPTMVALIEDTVTKAKNLSNTDAVEDAMKVTSTRGLVRMESLSVNDHLALAYQQLLEIETKAEAASEAITKNADTVTRSIGITEEEVVDTEDIRNDLSYKLVAKNYILNNVGIIDESSEI